MRASGGLDSDAPGHGHCRFTGSTGVGTFDSSSVFLLGGGGGFAVGGFGVGFGYTTGVKAFGFSSSSFGGIKGCKAADEDELDA